MTQDILKSDHSILLKQDRSSGANQNVDIPAANITKPIFPGLQGQSPALGLPDFSQMLANPILGSLSALSPSLKNDQEQRRRSVLSNSETERNLSAVEALMRIKMSHLDSEKKRRANSTGCTNLMPDGMQASCPSNGSSSKLSTSTTNNQQEKRKIKL